MRRRKFGASGNIAPDQIVRHALVQRLYKVIFKCELKTGRRSAKGRGGGGGGDEAGGR